MLAQETPGSWDVEAGKVFSGCLRPTGGKGLCQPWKVGEALAPAGTPFRLLCCQPAVWEVGPSSHLKRGISPHHPSLETEGDVGDSMGDLPPNPYMGVSQTGD